MKGHKSAPAKVGGSLREQEKAASKPPRPPKRQAPAKASAA
jgi:hypothetical protein